jgi:hypothetical protein
MSVEVVPCPIHAGVDLIDSHAGTDSTRVGQSKTATCGTYRPPGEPDQPERSEPEKV